MRQFPQSRDGFAPLPRPDPRAKIGSDIDFSAPTRAHRPEKTLPVTHKNVLTRSLLPLFAGLSLALAAPALGASVATEQQQGAQILTRVQHGQLNPKQLSTSQYENLGEYLMGQALGSTQLHERMNTLMDQMMGPAAADQMHSYLAERYLGITTTPSASATPLYGLMGVMMSGYHGSPLAGMMSRYLSGQGTRGYGMGPGMMGYSYGNQSTGTASGGWPASAIIAIVLLAALLIAGALAIALPRLRARSAHHPATTPH